MDINSRVKKLRNKLNLSQDLFGKKILLERSTISLIERNQRNVTDRIIKDLCAEFNASEEWLRDGTGEMFIEPDTFSLDHYLMQRGASDLEKEIIKCYFDIPQDIRNTIVDNFKSKILPTLSTEDNEITATKEETFEDYKQRELAAYAMELDAESKGETLSVSEDSEESLKLIRNKIS